MPRTTDMQRPKPLRAAIRRLGCLLGRHSPRETARGEPALFCAHGCGHSFTGAIAQRWLVTLNTGEVREVVASDDHQAIALVIHGHGISRGKGDAMTLTRIERSEIASARLVS